MDLSREPFPPEEAASSARRGIRETVCLLDTNVWARGLPAALDRIASWADAPAGRYVCVADTRSITLALNSDRHRRSMAGASMVTPDGMPLVLAGRLNGSPSMSRVCGPDLLPALCARFASQGWRHYFYGGAPGVAEELSRRLSKEIPGLCVAGTYSPPYRPISQAEDDEIVQRIISSRPNVVWVGLGCPKQEEWMHEHSKRIPNAILIGVGAAFDYHAGTKKRAPMWMQRFALEWLHRLLSEPRRLWRQYLMYPPQFALAVALDLVGPKRVK